MKLRTVTLWLAGLTLLLTMLIPTRLVYFALIGHLKIGVVAALIALTFWFLGSLPPVVSFFIARKLKYALPTGIILCLTLVYAGVYLNGLYRCFFVGGGTALEALFIGIPLLSVMIPAWIVALVLDLSYAKKSATVLGIARGTG